MLHTSASCLALSAAALSALAGQSPAVPDTVVDLRSQAGASLVAARWRYTDAHIVEAVNHAPGADLRPSGPPVTTHDIHPRIRTADFASAPWQDIAPDGLEERRTNGRLAFGWCRLDLTVPEMIETVPTAGSTIVLEVTVDDYAEVWTDADGEASLPQVLGQSGGPLVGGWNTPTRLTIARDAKPGTPIHLAIFAANGPLSDPPANFVWIRSATLDVYKPGHAPDHAPVAVTTTITRLDPALDAIISPGTQAHRVADGFGFTEGPVWIPALDPASGRTYGGGGLGGYLLFSDPNQNVIHRFDPATGAVSIFRTKSGYTGLGGAPIGEYHQPGSNGLALDAQGRLTICEHGNRRVTRLEPNGTITVLADRFDGKRLNSPNDLIYRSDGALYFTDPPYGLPKVYDDPRKELAVSGVYCLINGTLKQVSDDFKGPNGLAFSPDERFLYVDNWDEHRKVIVRYDANPDGTLANPTTIVDITAEPGEICFDGLKIDAAGNLYASAPGGVRVYSPAGKHLGTISIPEIPANFAFGGPDGRTLYMTARTGLYTVRVNNPGAARR